MADRRRLSNSVYAEAGTIHCAGCSHALGPAKVSWKESAALRETPVSALEGPYALSGKVLLREFVCPGCGTLLDTEIALPGDPLLIDQLA